MTDSSCHPSKTNTMPMILDEPKEMQKILVSAKDADAITVIKEYARLRAEADSHLSHNPWLREILTPEIANWHKIHQALGDKDYIIKSE